VSGLVFLWCIRGVSLARHAQHATRQRNQTHTNTRAQPPHTRSAARPHLRVRQQARQVVAALGAARPVVRAASVPRRVLPPKLVGLVCPSEHKHTQSGHTQHKVGARRAGGCGRAAARDVVGRLQLAAADRHTQHTQTQTHTHTHAHTHTRTHAPGRRGPCSRLGAAAASCRRRCQRQRRPPPAPRRWRRCRLQTCRCTPPSRRPHWRRQQWQRWRALPAPGSCALGTPQSSQRRRATSGPSKVWGPGPAA
jgi:hypothetical protein